MARTHEVPHRAGTKLVTRAARAAWRDEVLLVLAAMDDEDERLACAECGQSFRDPFACRVVRLAPDADLTVLGYVCLACMRAGVTMGLRGPDDDEVRFFLALFGRALDD